MRGHSLGDEGIDLAKVLDDLVDKLLDVLVLAHVDLVGLCADAVLALELLDVLLSTGGAGRVGDGDVGTILSSTTGGLNTHTTGTRGTGDDDDLSLEVEEVLEGAGLGDGLNHDGQDFLLGVGNWVEGRLVKGDGRKDGWMDGGGRREGQLGGGEGGRGTPLKTNGRHWLRDLVEESYAGEERPSDAYPHRLGVCHPLHLLPPLLPSFPRMGRGRRGCSGALA